MRCIGVLYSKPFENFIAPHTTEYRYIEQITIIFVLKGESKRMAKLKLISKHPDSLKQIIQSALSERLHNIEAGIKRTEERLQEFEDKYQLSTVEFIQSFNNNELPHNFDFDEWIGESLMLKHLQEKKEIIEDIQFVN